jgi:hypothetical protein
MSTQAATAPSPIAKTALKTSAVEYKQNNKHQLMTNIGQQTQ